MPNREEAYSIRTLPGQQGWFVFVHQNYGDDLGSALPMFAGASFDTVDRACRALAIYAEERERVFRLATSIPAGARPQEVQ